MEDLKLDLTTKEGLAKSQKDLNHFVKVAVLGATVSYEKNNLIGGMAKANIDIDIDIEGMFKNLIDLIKGVFDSIIGLFDDTKKLQMQMDLAKQTIEIARAGGAKSIEITLNSKNEAGLKLFLEEIDANLGGKFKKDNTITYSIVF